MYEGFHGYHDRRRGARAGRRGAQGGELPAPPWDTTAATVGPGPSAPGHGEGEGGGGDNLGRGHTQILDKALTYYTKTQHIQQK